MNSYGHPQHPEVAMLEELHRLWGRVFGAANAPRRGVKAWAVVGMVVLAAIVANVL
jgi:hypothetical protein